MGERRHSWWILPASLVVLVLFFELANRPAPAAGGRVAVPAVSRPGRVVLQDADGRRSAPLPLPGAGGALVLELGAALQGQRVELRLWQRDGGRRGPVWLSARPRVRWDGTVPIGGLPAGSYDVEVEVARGAAPPLAGHADGVELAAGATRQQALTLAPAPAAPGR